MTMLAVGRGLRDLAQRGMSAVSKAETVENQQQLALDTAKQQQQSATLGTGAGMGGMVGANRMLDASKAANTAVERANTALGNAGSIARDKLTGGIKFTPTGGETLKGAEAVSKLGETTKAIDDTAKALELATSSGEVLTVGTEAVAAGETAVAASQAAGPMAQLSALAAPVAIGLGVAFLLNKLFD